MGEIFQTDIQLINLGYPGYLTVDSLHGHHGYWTLDKTIMAETRIDTIVYDRPTCTMLTVLIWYFEP